MNFFPFGINDAFRKILSIGSCGNTGVSVGNTVLTVWHEPGIRPASTLPWGFYSSHLTKGSLFARSQCKATGLRNSVTVVHSFFLFHVITFKRNLNLYFFHYKNNIVIKCRKSRKREAMYSLLAATSNNGHFDTFLYCFQFKKKKKIEVIFFSFLFFYKGLFI